jgi:cyclophilin family peptidyl-prolyl cis-trans isomerase/protein-disulfide isomerase
MATGTIMVKRSFLALVLVSLGLAACSPVVTPASITATAIPVLHTVDPNAVQAGEISACTVVSGPTATPNATQVATTSLFKPVNADDWSLGASDAPVTIIEYSDFQCPNCALFHNLAAQILKDYPEGVKEVFREYPNPGYDKTMLAAQAAEAAGLQGKFWEMADLLYSDQATWTAMNSTDFQAWIEQAAEKAGLDVNRLVADMQSNSVLDKLNAAQAEGVTIGIPGTPFVLINGEIYQGPLNISSLETVISLLLLASKQVTGCPPVVIDVHKQYLAHLETNKGEIVIQLFPDVATIAVNSFVFLARRGWFDNVIFHRVIPGSYAQSGDPSGTGYGTPGYAFKDEISPDLKFDKAGVVGMANAGSGSNGSQFFITMGAMPDLDGKYTIFGQVVQGMDVVNSLAARDPAQAGTLPTADRIIKVTIEEK